MSREHCVEVTVEIENSNFHTVHTAHNADPQDHTQQQATDHMQ